jgi:hypothetical protein
MRGGANQARRLQNDRLVLVVTGDDDLFHYESIHI